jgi:hypothetical protein
MQGQEDIRTEARGRKPVTTSEVAEALKDYVGRTTNLALHNLDMALASAGTRLFLTLGGSMDELNALNYESPLLSALSVTR